MGAKPGADLTCRVALFDLMDETRADRRRRWTALGIGSLLQPIGVAMTIWSLAAPPFEIHRGNKKDYLYFEVASSPAPKPQSLAPPKLPPPARVQIPRLQLDPPQLEDPPPLIARAAVPPELPKLLPVYPPGPPPSLPAPGWAEAPKREVPPVRTTVFSGSSAAAMVNRAAGEVQTGGFGDVKGFRGDAQGLSRGNVARLGSFDLPAGPGSGNGSGGSRGVRGAVITAGFGSGIAGPRGGSEGSGRGAVRESGFADINSSPQVGEKRPRAVATPQLQSLEILAKPNPIYTEEARRLHVQGEVLLDVVFAASGELRVLRVVQGLGHGLDEAAARAAEQVVFKPARRDGQPVDFRATLHVVFQLAS